MYKKKSRFTVNESIKIIVESGPNEGEYKSKIIDVSKGKIKLALPTYEGEEVDLKKKNPLILSLEGSNAIYTVRVKVLKKVKRGIAGLIVTKDGDEKRIQRRKYVRVSLKGYIDYREVEYQNIGKCVLNNDKGSEFKEGKGIDISGGGLMMSVEDIKGIKVGGFLELKIKGLNLSCDTFNGEIVRMQGVEKDNGQFSSYIVGVKFIDITDKSREEIIEWVFAKQRDLRQKGLM
ncbi:flagellar brake protein [Halonatronum saccharophilum]|uniref:flagellar brake protein n=1 Tax=Halonatronum saccharophilum TaxID=150060 RepID=UPI000487C36E|nr:PilZ domain-containing protein [Halonatronum saccharophilum]